MSDMVVRAVVLACWGLFAVVWTVGAVLGWRAGGRAIRISFRQYLVAAPLIVAGWAVARWLPRSWWAAVTVTSRWPIVLGLAVLVVGTGVTLWARLALGSMWSSEVRVAENHQLRTTGPYGVTRHPIYSGLLTMVVGAVLATGVGRELVVIAVVYPWMVFKLREEERLLTEAFGDEYRRYRQRVPRLIPGLKGLPRR